MVKSKTSNSKTVKSSKVKKTTKGGTKKQKVVKTVVAKAPKSTKSTKSTKTKTKKSKTTTPTVVVEETVTVPTVIDDSELTDTTTTTTNTATKVVTLTDETVSVTSDTPHSRLVTIFSELRDIQSQMKALQARERKLVIEAERFNTRVGKELGRLQKKANRRKNVNTNSGIMKKHDLPSGSRLVQFIHGQIDAGNPKVTDLEKNAAYSRVDCLRAITGYIKEANLQDPDQGIYINIDSALETLFPELKGSTGEDRLKYRSIMTHLGPHFKAPVSEEVSATA
jgi:hypothetical protein